MQDDQGRGVFVISPEPILSAYNEKLLTASEVPTTYAQLVRDVSASPAKFKLVSYPITNPLAYGAVYGLIHILGAKTVWSDLKVLGPNTKTYNEGLDGLQYMVQGGASIGYISSGLSQGLLPHFQGLANYVFMADATPLIPRGIGMAAGASNPASAQLFMDFLFSGPGQQALCGAGFEASISRQPLLHHPIPEWVGGVTTFACLHNPAHIDRGPVYQFNLNHVLFPEHLEDVYRLELLEVGAARERTSL